LKKLAAFLDVDKAKRLGLPEIEAVWRLRHASSASSLCAAIPSSTYSRIAETARAHPRFVLPLPTPVPPVSSHADAGEHWKRQGVTLHYVEWAFPAPDTTTVIMTRLDELKRRGEFALPHTTATLHLELAKTNGVVLLQGQAAEDRGMGADGARLLMMLVQKFYAAGAATRSGRQRHRLLQQFTAGSEEFDVDALIEEAEMVE
jgi:ATP synthase F1 complex assembly factor 1